MLHAARIAIVSATLLLSAITTSYQSSTNLQRRDMMIHSYPRIGRGQAWLAPLDELILKYKTDHSKREKYHAFPRVGRSDVPPLRERFFAEPYRINRLRTKPLEQQDPPSIRSYMELIAEKENRIAKRESGKEKTNLWFGPRLGRGEDGEDANYGDLDS